MRGRPPRGELFGKDRAKALGGSPLGGPGYLEPGHNCSAKPPVSPLSRVGQAIFGFGKNYPGPPSIVDDVSSYKPLELREGEPSTIGLMPIGDYQGLLGLTGACWEDLAALPEALMALMISPARPYMS